MVYFTCNNCGASLKKNTVDKHKGQCRHPLALTCVDCHKDFYGQDYVAHTKCITEDEKYSAKGFQSRPSSNKGELKQQSWLEMVHHVNNASTNLSYEERQLLNNLTKHDNIPQKKQKFQNFTKNIWPAAKYNLHVVDRIWDLLDAENKSRKEKVVKDSTAAEPVKNDETEDSKESVLDVETNVMKGETNVSKEILVDEKLSKQEKKSKRKKEKYELELTELKTMCDNGNSGNKDVDGNDEDEALEKMTKKERKKMKLKKAESEVNSGQNTAAEHKSTNKKNSVLNGENESKEIEDKKEIGNAGREGKSKRKRNMNQETLLVEPSKKKSKANGNGTNMALIQDTPVTSSKFNWTEIILQVLENTKDKELLVKRLRKKVLSEYESTIEGSEIDVKIIAKFNKKLSKTPGVVVLKDRAKLKC